MRYKAFKIILIAAGLFLSTLSGIPTPGSADPYTDKLESNAAVKKFMAAVLNEDADLVEQLSYMPTAFHFDKKKKIEKFLRNYFDSIAETRKIEIKDLKIKNDHEAEAVVSVYRFDRREDIVGMDLKPTEETWSFMKARGSSFPKDQRGKWLFVLELVKRNSAFY